MVIVDITDVNPFDVLLTSGTATSSLLNRIAQKAIRRAPAPYSHAAMFISPFVLIESLDKPGIILTDLFGPRVNTNSDNRAQAHIFVRSNAHGTRIYARLDGVKDAEVRRYRPLHDAPPVKLENFLEDAIGALARVYLAQYPPYLRLARVARIIPDPAMTLLEKIGRSWQRKGDVGPFCSELVTMLLGAIDPCIYEHISDPASVSPSDIYNNGLVFSDVSGHDFDTSARELSGVAEQLRNSLQVPELESQIFYSKLAQLIPRMPAVAKMIGASPDAVYNGEHLPAYYEGLLVRLKAALLLPLSNHVKDALLVMDWIKSANHCLETCPARRKPPRENFGRPRLQIAWEHGGPASEPCADARYCNGIFYNWNRLNNILMERSEARDNARG